MVQPRFKTNDHEQTGIEWLLSGKSFSKLHLSVPRKSSGGVSLVGISWQATHGWRISDQIFHLGWGNWYLFSLWCIFKQQQQQNNFTEKSQTSSLLKAPGLQQGRNPSYHDQITSALIPKVLLPRLSFTTTINLTQKRTDSLELQV